MSSVDGKEQVIRESEKKIETGSWSVRMKDKDNSQIKKMMPCTEETVKKKIAEENCLWEIDNAGVAQRLASGILN